MSPSWYLIFDVLSSLWFTTKPLEHSPKSQRSSDLGPHGQKWCSSSPKISIPPLPTIPAESNLWSRRNPARSWGVYRTASNYLIHQTTIHIYSYIYMYHIYLYYRINGISIHCFERPVKRKLRTLCGINLTPCIHHAIWVAQSRSWSYRSFFHRNRLLKPPIFHRCIRSLGIPW